MIINKIEELRSHPLFFHLEKHFGLSNLFLKIEGFNIAGSIKIKTALSLMDQLEREGASPSKNKIIESSSGNLGIALSIVCKSRGYTFTCVTDPNTSPHSERLMRIYGADILKVTKKDKQGGYLETRISLIEEMITKDKSLIWTNQYSSIANPLIHYKETAKEILNQFEKVDYLFIGAGTTGTLVGCAKHIKEVSPQTRVFAVDSEGSVTFGGQPSPRFIPGLGTSKRPPICDTKNVDEIIVIKEGDAIQMCHFMLDKYGLFLGGSTGSVLQAVREKKNIPKDACIVAISPDFGEKYIDTVYNPTWVKEKFNMEI
jgi:2,3-diaminopropionate biosynthesis protein SbnA